MGLTLIWGVMNVINLAHGADHRPGQFWRLLAVHRHWACSPTWPCCWWRSAGLLFGILIYFIAIQRVINAPHLSTLLATFSINMIIIGMGTAVQHHTLHASTIQPGHVSTWADYRPGHPPGGGAGVGAGDRRLVPVPVPHHPG